MRVLVVSDSHNNVGNLARAIDAAGSFDALIHLGDGEADLTYFEELLGNCRFLRVAGNCDIGSSAPRELLVDWEGVHLLLCHGDQYMVKQGLAMLAERGVEVGADLVLYGHTHLARSEYVCNLHLLNPGTLWGRAPFLSFALLEIADGVVTAEIQLLEE